MEAIATLFNDSFLALDEISEAKSTEIGGIIYSLANGVGKQRAKKMEVLKQQITGA
jgi:putative DNA primase/helicase